MTSIGGENQGASGDEREERLQKFFTALSADYSSYTGQSTKELLAQAMKDLDFRVNHYSNVHDNACGPGTATEAILEMCERKGLLEPTIIATDFNKAMIEAMKTAYKGRENVTAKVMHSANLDFKDDVFTHTFCNFSIFTFTNPLKALHEIHRTLRPGSGLAVISTWKRFSVVEIIQAAQKAIKGEEAKVMGAEGDVFMQEGYLTRMVEEAGWERGKIRVIEEKIIVKGEDMNGIVAFMKSNKTAPARMGYSNEENGKWPEAVDKAVKELVDKHGGLPMEAWIVIARKWDAQSA